MRKRVVTESGKGYVASEHRGRTYVYREHFGGNTEIGSASSLSDALALVEADSGEKVREIKNG